MCKPDTAGKGSGHRCYAHTWRPMYQNCNNFAETGPHLPNVASRQRTCGFRVSRGRDVRVTRPHNSLHDTVNRRARLAHAVCIPRAHPFTGTIVTAVELRHTLASGMRVVRSDAACRALNLAVAGVGLLLTAPVMGL